MVSIVKACADADGCFHYVVRIIITTAEDRGMHVVPGYQVTRSDVMQTAGMLTVFFGFDCHC